MIRITIIILAILLILMCVIIISQSEIKVSLCDNPQCSDYIEPAEKIIIKVDGEEDGIIYVYRFKRQGGR